VERVAQFGRQVRVLPAQTGQEQHPRGDDHVQRQGPFQGPRAFQLPTVNPAHVTPHSEAFQAGIWHLFVSHPKLKQAATKWESTK
jgi:hypothetical protein